MKSECSVRPSPARSSSSLGSTRKLVAGEEGRFASRAEIRDRLERDASLGLTTKADVAEEDSRSSNFEGGEEEQEGVGGVVDGRDTSVQVQGTDTEEEPEEKTGKGVKMSNRCRSRRVESSRRNNSLRTSKADRRLDRKATHQVPFLPAADDPCFQRTRLLLLQKGTCRLCKGCSRNLLQRILNHQQLRTGSASASDGAADADGEEGDLGRREPFEGWG